MFSNMDKMEIERIENLISSFGWELVSQVVVDKKLVLTIEKATDGVDVTVDLSAS